MNHQYGGGTFPFPGYISHLLWAPPSAVHSIAMRLAGVAGARGEGRGSETREQGEETLVSSTRSHVWLRLPRVRTPATQATVAFRMYHIEIYIYVAIAC